MSQDNVTFKGSFLPVPAAFDGIPLGLANVLKVEMVPETCVNRKSGKKLEQNFNVAVVTHRALIDFAAMNVHDIDFDKLERDCDLMKLALNKHRTVIRQALDLVSTAEPAAEDIESVNTLLTKAGLTEEAFHAQDGGMIGLVVAMVACLLLASCAHTKHTRKGGVIPDMDADGE